MAAAKSKKGKTPQKTLPKTALTWEELLVEKALAMMSETDRQINESAERFERQMREKNRQVNESAEWYEHQIKETVEQADHEIIGDDKEKNRDITGIDEQADTETGSGKHTGRKTKGSVGQTGRGMREFDRQFEDPIRRINSPNLMQKFREQGFVFERSYKEDTINDKRNNISVDVDLTLESGDKIMIVKTMNRPTARDITGHIERMKKMRRYGDLHGEKRKYLGAVSGINFNEDEKLFAMKNGFYVIEPSGETFTITAPKGVYHPREW